MTKTEPKEKTALLTKRFVLTSPIPHEEGAVTTHTVSEPLVHQWVRAEREAKTYGGVIPALLAQISDLPKDLFKALKIRDANAVRKWLAEINQEALDAAGIKIPVESDVTGEDPFAIEDEQKDLPEADAVLEPEHTFKLLVPVSYGGREYRSLTLSEPDLEAATAAAQFKHETEQSAAMLAVMAGEKIPVITRLSYRDFHCLETWATPFVQELPAAEAG